MGFLASRRPDKTSESEFDAFEVVAAQVVDVIATAGVVLDQSNNVLRASPGAIQFGLVQNRRLIHSSLVNLADRARLPPACLCVLQVRQVQAHVNCKRLHRGPLDAQEGRHLRAVLR